MSGLHTLLKSARADIACSKKPHSKQMILKGTNMINKLISYFGTFTPGLMARSVHFNLSI